MSAVNIRLICCLVCLAVCGMVTGALQAEVPHKINYQGKIVESVTGEAKIGSHSMVFGLYDDPSAGTLLWSESQTVQADSAGVFSAILGSITPIAASFYGPVWLEVEVEGEVLSPRREVVSVPFAFRAEVADHSLNADSLGGYGSGDFVREGETSVITSEMILDGTGSGLDADMLDGRNADSFADSAHIHDDRYYTQDSLNTPGSLNEGLNPVDWTKLKGVPGGFADGVDDLGGAGDGHSLDAADGDPVDVVFVSNAGSVGVGTLTPGEKLEVDGSVDLAEHLKIGGSTVLSVDGSSNTLLGVGAGANNTGDRNTFLGTSAGNANVGGYGNTYLGAEAGVLAVSGLHNTFVGNQAGSENEMGQFNTFVGAGAGYEATGSFNTFVGNAAGYQNEGDHNVFLGWQAGYNEMGSDKLYIANGQHDYNVLIYGDFAEGRVGIGTTAPERTLHMVGDNPRLLIDAASSNPEINFRNSGDAYSEMWALYKDGNTDDLRLFQSGDKVTFESTTGNVGIGMENPISKLDIAGDVNAATHYRIAGDTVLVTSGAGNTYVGVGAGADNADDYNTFLGAGAGRNSTGGENTFLGAWTGRWTTGEDNVFIGAHAGSTNATGGYNVFVGRKAGYRNETGERNTFVGVVAGGDHVSGSGNTFIGSQAGYWTETGTYNTAIGTQAGGAGGDRNVFIGYYAGFRETGSDKLYIASGEFGTNTLIYGEFDTGRIGLGTLEPEEKLHIAGDNPRVLIEAEASNPEVNLRSDGDTEDEVWAMYKDSSNDDLYFFQNDAICIALKNSTGRVGIGTHNVGSYKLYVQGEAYSTVAWSSSDQRFKKEVGDISNALDRVLGLRGVNFKWRTEEYADRGFPEGEHFGVIAQEAEGVLPEIVKDGPGGEKSVAYAEIIPVLIESIRELKAENDALKERIIALEISRD